MRLQDANPFNPPDSNAHAWSIRRRTWVGIVSGTALLLFGLINVARIAYYCISYPGLTDPTAGELFYWPGLEVELSKFVIIIAIPLSLAILVTSIFSLRRQQELAGRRVED